MPDQNSQPDTDGADQPVTLDMSTAQPIQQPVTMDMSTAQPLPTATLAQRVKAKYPEYSDVDDATLETKILAKYPEYANVPRTKAAQPTAPGVPDPKKAVGEQMDNDAVRATFAGVPGGSPNVVPASDTAVKVAATGIGAAAVGTGAEAALPFAVGGVKAVAKWAKDNPTAALAAYEVLKGLIPGAAKAVGIGKKLAGE
jgi:hypothetical protein